MKLIRKGVTASELIWIALHSQRPEERHSRLMAVRHAHDDPEAIVLEIEGRVVAAGGLRKFGALGALWITSTVDLRPYRRPLLQHARRLIAAAQAAGLQVVSAVPRDIPRAKVISEHFGLRPERQAGTQILYSL